MLTSPTVRYFSRGLKLPQHYGHKVVVRWILLTKTVENKLCYDFCSPCLITDTFLYVSRIRSFVSIGWHSHTYVQSNVHFNYFCHHYHHYQFQFVIIWKKSALFSSYNASPVPSPLHWVYVFEMKQRSRSFQQIVVNLRSLLGNKSFSCMCNSQHQVFIPPGGHNLQSDGQTTIIIPHG